MTTKTEDRYALACDRYAAHTQVCQSCSRFDGSTKNLYLLCSEGTRAWIEKKESGDALDVMIIKRNASIHNRGKEKNSGKPTESV